MRNTLCLAVLSLIAASTLVACGDDGSTPTTTSSGSGGSGGGDGDGDGDGATTGGSTSSASGSTSSATNGASSASGASTGAGEGGQGQGGQGQGGQGEGGAGGGGDVWPPCVIDSFGGEEQTILDVWSDDPSVSTPYWVPGVVVTAVSDGGCVDGEFCQIFVQQEEVFADLADGAQQAIRVLVAPEVSIYFEGIGVGDIVDLGGEASRDTTDDRNELRFFVRESAPGCMDIVDVGDPQPVDAALVDLTQQAYEETMGPLLVRLETVSGRPHQPSELFALWDTEEGPDDGGIETVTNASPFFIPGGVFVALVPEVIVDFASVTGVFGQFYVDDTGSKYETIYLRNMGDAPFVE